MLRARRPAVSRVQRRALTQLMNDPNPGKAHAVVRAMLKMDKIIIADLKKAYESA
jgi:predicted 3-demethylubiquinone-9 3-methyltransferase (glyoxalase superfamily)